jgi:hypothetical protein
MTAVPSFSDQHTSASAETMRQHPLLWEGPRLIQQKVWIDALGQNPSQLVKKFAGR